MLKNHFKTAWRSLKGNKFYSLVNISGLTCGLATVIPLLLWVQHALIFSLLAISISCLGLFGLASNIAETRIKEIGIRKVLGASVSSVVGLLSKDFVKLVLISIVIASPIAWWPMNNWLENFTYRIDIDWWMFAIAGLTAVVTALLTVSWQAIRAAVANPVDSLRDE